MQNCEKFDSMLYHMKMTNNCSFLSSLHFASSDEYTGSAISYFLLHIVHFEAPYGISKVLWLEIGRNVCDIMD